MDIDAAKLEEFKRSKEYHKCEAKINLYENVLVELYNMLKNVKQRAKLSDDYKLYVLVARDDSNLRVYFEEEKEEDENTGN